MKKCFLQILIIYTEYGILYKINRNLIRCTLGVFLALDFVADFLPVAPEFHQRTHRVRLKNLGTTDKKSSHKIKHKKIPRVHYGKMEEKVEKYDKKKIV